MARFNMDYWELLTLAFAAGGANAEEAVSEADKVVLRRVARPPVLMRKIRTLRRTYLSVCRSNEAHEDTKRQNWSKGSKGSK